MKIRIKRGEGKSRDGKRGGIKSWEEADTGKGGGERRKVTL